MFKRYFLTSAAAIVCATALTSAQTPTTGAAPQVPPAVQSARPSPQSTTTERAPERSPVTVTGCLMREQDVAGRSPGDTNRAARLEDYILTSASSPRPEAGRLDAATSGAVGTSGTTAAPTAHNGAMYKIKGISDMQLKSLVGKRVEVVGLMNEDMKASSSAAAPSAKAPAIGSGSQTANADRGEEKTQWSSFAASSIREVSGSCPPRS
jgi:hypothetical protein